MKQMIDLGKCRFQQLLSHIIAANSQTYVFPGCLTPVPADFETPTFFSSY